MELSVNENNVDAIVDWLLDVDRIAEMTAEEWVDAMIIKKLIRVRVPLGRLADSGSKLGNFFELMMQDVDDAKRNEEFTTENEKEHFLNNIESNMGQLENLMYHLDHLVLCDLMVIMADLKEVDIKDFSLEIQRNVSVNLQNLRFALTMHIRSLHFIVIICEKLRDGLIAIRFPDVPLLVEIVPRILGKVDNYISEAKDLISNFTDCETQAVSVLSSLSKNTERKENGSPPTEDESASVAAEVETKRMNPEL